METYLQKREEKNISIINAVLILHAALAIIKWFLPVSGYLTNGIILFFFPAVELFIIICNWMHYSRKPVFPYVILPLVFHLYMIIRHSLNGDIMSHGASDFFTLLFVLCAMLALTERELIDRFHIFSKAMLVLCIATTAVSLLALIYPINPAGAMLDGRFQGITGHPNTLGNIVAYCYIIGFACCLLQPQKASNWILFLCGTVATAVVLVGSQCRSAMLFTGVSVIGFYVFYLVFWRKRLPRKVSLAAGAVLLLLIFAIIAFILLFFISPQVQETVLGLLRVPYREGRSAKETLATLLTYFQDASGRDEIRVTAIENWKNNILFGVNTDRVLEGYTQQAITNSKGSHDSFIQILATLGLTGLIFFLSMYASAFYCAFKAAISPLSYEIRTISMVIVVIFVAVAINSTYENQLYTSIQVMVLIFYFLIASSYQLANTARAARIVGH